MATFGGASEDGKKFTFGSAAAGGVSFGSGLAEGSKPFSLDATQGSEPLFGGDAKEVTKFGESTASEKAQKAGKSGEEEEEGVAEAESTQEFTPVVQLEEIEVRTMEEDEEILFKMRSRLFRFTETLLNKGSGSKEWIERGVGEVKLLKHRENSKIRVLMRQERTMKVICNHVADPRISLQPNAGNDKSWVWSAFDFSDGELVEEVFAMRFANADNAAKFKDAFTDAQKHMEHLLAGDDGPADPEADDALASLKTKEDDEAAAT